MNAKNPPYTAQSCREEAAINDKFGDPIMNDPDLLRAHADLIERCDKLKEHAEAMSRFGETGPDAYIAACNAYRRDFGEEK